MRFGWKCFKTSNVGRRSFSRRIKKRKITYYNNT